MNSDEYESMRWMAAVKYQGEARPMTKTQYIEPPNFRAETRQLLAKIIEVVESYRERGYRMTLRQLYYQLVAKVVFANRQANYARLSDILGTARMAGLVDWDFIEDRIRVPRFPNEFSNLAKGIDVLTNVYRLDRWHGQDNYVEVWVKRMHYPVSSNQ